MGITLAECPTNWIFDKPRVVPFSFFAGEKGKWDHPLLFRFY